MDIKRSGSQPSARPPAEYFTGTVRPDTPFKGTGESRVGGATVTFEPGARTAWHSHPLGQTLLIHGAGPANAMSHVAIAEALDGRGTDWMEKVTDAECVT